MAVSICNRRNRRRSKFQFALSDLRSSLSSKKNRQVSKIKSYKKLFQEILMFRLNKKISENSLILILVLIFYVYVYVYVYLDGHRKISLISVCLWTQVWNNIVQFKRLTQEEVLVNWENWKFLKISKNSEIPKINHNLNK